MPELGDGESNPPSKKMRKLRAGSTAAEEEVASASAVKKITLRVASLDGSSLDLTVPSQELVSEVKRTIGQVWHVVVCCDCLQPVCLEWW
jgi:hypothetical protein